MAFVIHPLTQQNSEPKYKASDFRLTVSNFLTVGTDEAFGAVQGIRSDSLAAHVSMTDSTITVYPHSGIIAPWTGVGAYAYAITSDITVQRPTTGDYYVVLTVDDPSQSHGSEPQGRVDLIPTSTPRESINGLVIAKTTGSTIGDIANRLRNGTVIETVSKEELDLIKPVNYTKALVRFGDGMGEYEFYSGKWNPIMPKPFSLTYESWEITGKPVGDKLWHIRYLKRYDSGNPSYAAEIPIDLPISVPFAQNIQGIGYAAYEIPVESAFLRIVGQRGNIRFSGYDKAVTVEVQGIIYTN